MTLLALLAGACGNGDEAAVPPTPPASPSSTAVRATVPPGVGRTGDAAGYRVTEIDAGAVSIPLPPGALENVSTMLFHKDGVQVAFAVKGTLAPPPASPREAKAAVDALLVTLAGGGEVETVALGGPKVDLVQTAEGKTVAGAPQSDGTATLWVGPDRAALVEMLAAMTVLPEQPSP